ncbi:hypothetical protein ACF1BN_15795 [Streptomyces sp. NPDC014861]|uniref:hypothetical protein n=1 Tax=Streptomyces sp. NPDC014861 TaxID=3364923 RepID=UPI0036F7FB5B
MALPPPRTAQIYHSGAWHPVSVREADSVTITRGLSGAGTRAEPTAATMTLGNRNGELSVYDPASAVYGKVGRNTPLTFTVDAGGPWAVLPGDETASLTTPDSPVLGGNGDLDVRVEIASDDYSAPQELAERWVMTGNQRSWTLSMLNTRQLQLRWSPDGTGTGLGVAGTLARFPAYPRQRIALRATLDVDNGKGGWTASFYWARSLDSPVWHLIETGSGGGVTSIHDGTAGLRLGTTTAWVGTGLRGKAYGMQLRTGIGGPAAVDLRVPRDASLGDTSFMDATGLTWSLTGSVTLSNRHTRLEGETPAWPPERHISGGDSVVKIAPAGILRRLGTGKKPLQSALRRAILAAGPIECWPLTDGPEAASGAPLVGTNPMLDQGGPNARLSWGRGRIADWIEPVLQADTGGSSRLDATCPASATATNGWAVDWVRVGGGTVPGPELFHFVDSGAEGSQWVWTVETDPPNDRVRVNVSHADTGDGPAIVNITNPGIYDGGPHHLRLQVENIAGDSYWKLLIDGAERGSGSWTEPTKPLAYIACMYILNLMGGAPPVSTGYLTYWGANRPPAADLYRAMLGYSAETAGERIVRVATEQGVPVGCDGDPAATEPLGAQKMETFLDVLETASDADLGLLLDRRDDRALLYRTRASLYSQAPVLTLDYSSGVISELRPKDGDRLVRNEITVTRDGGSEHTAVLPEGPMSVQDPPDGAGRYDEGKTLSLASDGQTVDQAWWRLHLGTVEGLRYPQVTVDCANPRAAPLLADILAADVGDLLRLQTLPRENGPDDIDLLIRGYTETIGAEEWKITFVCDPGDPWTVGVLNDNVLGRADTAGCILGAAVGPADTTMTLVTTKGPPWITTALRPGQFPLDLRIGGERVRVTALAAGVADSFTRTVASSWGTADSGGTWAQAGGAAADYAVAGGVGTHTLSSVNISRRTSLPGVYPDVDLSATISVSATAAGGSIFGGLMIRALDGDNLYHARTEFTTSGALILALRERAAAVESTLATVTLPYTYTAGAQLRLRVQATGTTLRARLWPVADIEPGVWHVTATDSTLTTTGSVGCRSILSSTNTNPAPVVRYDDVAMWTPQRATVIRSVNGVQKGHSGGSDVRLFRPMIAAL